MKLETALIETIADTLTKESESVGKQGVFIAQELRRGMYPLMSMGSFEASLDALKAQITMLESVRLEAQGLSK